MKIKQLTILFIFLFGVISCANEEEENETCGAPTLDGSLQNLSGSCLVDETEHIRLEGVNVPSGETLTIYAFASSATDEDGFKVVFRGGASGEIELDHPAADMSGWVRNQDLTAGNTYCVDFHNGEMPIHVLAWSQAGCDSSEGEALFNSEDDVTWNAEDDPNPTGSSFNYKSSSDRVKAQKIEGREHIFED